MKTKSIIAIIALACIAFTGCVTKPVVTTDASGQSLTNFVKAPDVERISAVAGDAAMLGSHFWLASHPNDRANFVLANEALKGLIASKNYDPGAFANALQALPIKELKGNSGAIYIQGAILVFDQGLAFASPVLRQELVAATLKCVQSGLQRTLDATSQ